MNNKEPNYVYIQTNPKFREDWVKIGKNSRLVAMGELRKNQNLIPIISYEQSSKCGMFA